MFFVTIIEYLFHFILMYYLILLYSYQWYLKDPLLLLFLHVQGSPHCSGSPTMCSCNKCSDGWEHRSGKCWQYVGRCEGNAQFNMLPTVPQNPSSSIAADFDNANKIGAAVMTEPDSEDPIQTECTNDRSGRDDYHCECDWSTQVCVVFHTQYWRE